MAISVDSAQIGINLYTDNAPPKFSIFRIFLSRSKQITPSITLKEGVLRYKPIALVPIFNVSNRKQKFIGILDELIQAAEIVGRNSSLP